MVYAHDVEGGARLLLFSHGHWNTMGTLWWRVLDGSICGYGGQVLSLFRSPTWSRVLPLSTMTSSFHPPE